MVVNSANFLNLRRALPFFKKGLLGRCRLLFSQLVFVKTLQIAKGGASFRSNTKKALIGHDTAFFNTFFK